MNFYLDDILANSALKHTFNEMKWYFVVNSIKKNLIYSRDILTAWQMIKSQYSIVVQMTKNILVISFHKIKIKCVFNLEHDICIYHWDHLHENIIKKIMKLKVAKLITRIRIFCSDSILFQIRIRMRWDFLILTYIRIVLYIKNDNKKW